MRNYLKTLLLGLTFAAVSLPAFAQVINGASGVGSFTGSTSGSTTVQASAVASGTLTLPATTATLATTSNVLSDFASTTSAQLATVISNETGTGVLVFGTAPALINPVITGPAPVACGATCAPTAGQLTTFAVASGGTATIPTSSGSGNVIRFRTTTTQSSATIKILLTTTTDVIIGTAIGENAGTAKVFVGNAGTFHSIQMPFAGTQPSGGFNGDTITCTDMAVGSWACDIVYQAGTTPTTPYSASTS